MLPAYAELHCLSNFTFLRGASQPEELVARAQVLGYAALAITDECSLAGVVRAHEAAKEAGSKLILGSEIALSDGPRLVLLATERESYGDLSELITRGRRQAEKGSYVLSRADLQPLARRCLALWLPTRGLGATVADEATAEWLQAHFSGRAWIAVELLARAGDRRWLAALQALGARLGLPCVAAGDVHMHARARRPLQDTLTAIRHKLPVAAAGYRLFPNGERHLRSRAMLAGIYPPELLAESVAIAERCSFSLDSLRYEYPEELVPAGETASSHLRRLTEAGLKQRYPAGLPARVRELVEHELVLIAELKYEAYFLTVHDLVAFAKGRGILCQGRGSAANSAVCYALFITEVDPSRMSMLFERFISRERNEPPDIDVDFEHQRREEVMQYVYAKYGRDRAALAATVISYRPKSAIRDVGKALGLDLEQVDRLAKNFSWHDGRKVMPERIAECGLDPLSPVVLQLLQLTNTLQRFPRHLSQHVGGFVISRGPLCRMVPIENASMPERTVIQWDKDDLDALGLLKVDCLALGMLSAIRRALDLVSKWQGRLLTLQDIPAEDPAVYEMIGHADTVGVFQIESRAQMAMLPRLRPENFYDLVVEVAIVRPGPIQGGMVHPYLRRRQGLEPVTYPSEAVRGVLERTLGVPIFQEQVMQLAVVAAGFTPGEADQLRRSMAAWKRKGGLGHFEERLIGGMRERGYNESFARQIFAQIQGFGEYGFPESHAASFALLVYVSAWLKRHHPAAFCAALLNSLPMGFYSASQLVQDAQRHGVSVRPAEVTVSGWECSLEAPGGAETAAPRNVRSEGAAFRPASLGSFAGPGASPDGFAAPGGEPALRLGLNRVKGFNQAAAERIVAARETGSPFLDAADLARRAQLDRGELGCLAAAGALMNLAGHRRRAAWEVAGIEHLPPLLAEASFDEAVPVLEAPSEGENIVADYATLGLTLGRHPLALLREGLRRRRLLSAREIAALPHGRIARAAGLVTCRQRPDTESGVTFVTLEDETGMINVVVWRDLAQRQRRELLAAQLLGVYGKLERQGEVIHLIAGRLVDLSSLLGRLETRSRDFH